MNQHMTFGVLREANLARLPRFKNKHGQPAHSMPDGSDWTPAQWLQATLGELGEFAAARIAYEQGTLSPAAYKKEAGKELADFSTYADILALRCLDDIKSAPGFDRAQMLMHLVAELGAYANAAKKYERGDLSADEFNTMRVEMLREAGKFLVSLMSAPLVSLNKVSSAHSVGVDLGQNILDKFNEVSERVDAGVFIREVAPGVNHRLCVEVDS